MATRKHTEISIKEKVETVMETVMERVVDSWLKKYGVGRTEVHIKPYEEKVRNIRFIRGRCKF